MKKKHHDWQKTGLILSQSVAKDKHRVPQFFSIMIFFFADCGVSVRFDQFAIFNSG
jgi:hypothetical protein